MPLSFSLLDNNKGCREVRRVAAAAAVAACVAPQRAEGREKEKSGLGRHHGASHARAHQRLFEIGGDLLSMGLLPCTIIFTRCVKSHFSLVLRMYILALRRLRLVPRDTKSRAAGGPRSHGVRPAAAVAPARRGRGRGEEFGGRLLLLVARQA